MTRDREAAVCHAGRGPGSGIPGDCKSAPLHQAAGLDADVAVDINFALAHTSTDAVEALVAAFEADLCSVAHTDFEYVPGKHTFARRLELDGGYTALAQTNQTIRR